MLQEPFKIVVNTMVFARFFFKFVFRNTFEILSKVFQNLISLYSFRDMILVKRKEQGELPKCK